MKIFVPLQTGRNLECGEHRRFPFQPQRVRVDLTVGKSERVLRKI